MLFSASKALFWLPTASLFAKRHNKPMQRFFTFKGKGLSAFLFMFCLQELMLFSLSFFNVWDVELGIPGADKMLGIFLHLKEKFYQHSCSYFQELMHYLSLFIKVWEANWVPQADPVLEIFLARVNILRWGVHIYILPRYFFIGNNHRIPLATKYCKKYSLFCINKLVKVTGV